MRSCLPPTPTTPTDTVAIRKAFSRAYAAFGTGECWELHPSALSALGTLRTWRMSYGPAAVLSNFDERLPSLLHELGLGNVFDVVMHSSMLGVEKPCREAFDAVRTHARINLPASQCIHVGDSVDKDVMGAVAAGWSVIFFCYVVCVCVLSVVT